MQPIIQPLVVISGFFKPNFGKKYSQGRNIMLVTKTSSQSLDPRVDTLLYTASRDGNREATVTIEFKSDCRTLQLPMLSNIFLLDDSGVYISATLDLSKLNDLIKVNELERVALKKTSHIS